MKAFVTGASGFLGGRLVAQLLDDGHEVRCLVRSAAAFDALREAAGPDKAHLLEPAVGTLERIRADTNVAEGCEVVHHVAAALKGATPVLFAANVIATRELIAAVNRPGLRRFVLVSSMGVFGVGHLKRGGVVDETCPLDPQPHRRDPYSYSKITQESVCWDAHRDAGLPLVVVRPGNIYGPGRDPLTGRVGIRIGSVMIRMGGGQAMPYVHVDDCARAVLLAGTTPGIEGEAFNVVVNDFPTGRALLRRYRREVGGIRTLPIPRWAIQPLSGTCEWYHRRSRGQLPAVLTRYKSTAMWKSLRYSNEKAKTRLGWSPRVGSAEGLKQTLAWLRERKTQA